MGVGWGRCYREASCFSIYTSWLTSVKSSPPRSPLPSSAASPAGTECGLQKIGCWKRPRRGDSSQQGRRQAGRAVWSSVRRGMGLGSDNDKVEAGTRAALSELGCNFSSPSSPFPGWVPGLVAVMGQRCFCAKRRALRPEQRLPTRVVPRSADFAASARDSLATSFRRSLPPRLRARHRRQITARDSPTPSRKARSCLP